MQGRGAVSTLFAVGAAYDGALGLAFLFASEAIFRWYGVTPPNHWGYVQFPALLLITFAIMFIAIAIGPVRNRNLIPYGIMLKASYCGVVAYWWASPRGVPGMWKPFAVFDLAFLILFWVAWVYLGRVRRSSVSAPAM